MKIKQILMAVVFTAVLIGCESTDPKEAGEKAAKEVCEKMKSGNFSQVDAQKFMSEAQASIDNPEDAAIWLKAYLAKAADCMK
jgi:PBP1b-binding outer membrane lipoprotein LpoB